MLPIDFTRQVLPGTLEYSLSYLIEHELDLSIFNDRYQNEEGGRASYDPAILLKIILLAYTRGVTSSRKIEQLCRENILFMAISADSGYHNRVALGYLDGQHIDGYIADTGFRSRDPRFKSYERYKPKDRLKPKHRFTVEDFNVNLSKKTCQCSAGKAMWLKCKDGQIGHHRSVSEASAR